MFIVDVLKTTDQSSHKHSYEFTLFFYVGCKTTKKKNKVNTNHVRVHDTRPVIRAFKNKRILLKIYEKY